MAKVYGFNRENRKGREIITVLDVASAMLTFESMPHKKLQKLCYYTYAWFLTFYGEHLFSGLFEAWIHGPVHPDLYQVYKENGWKPIDQVSRDSLTNISAETYEFLGIIYGSYGGLTGDELEAVTHDEEPWTEARGGLPEYEPSQNPINEDTIIRFYKGVSERAQTE